MAKSYDIGSLPFTGDFQKFTEGASNHGKFVNDTTEFFEKKTVESLLDKIKAGINIPNYTQYRDMTQMFLDLIEGIQKINGNYIETTPLTLKKGKNTIPEISAIKNHSLEISESIKEPFQLRLCITGPYTMSSLLSYKNKESFTQFGNVLTQIVENNIFSAKEGSVRIVTIDEPVFGFADDPLLDHGSEGRENLLKAWETIMQKIRSKGAEASLHLHNTSNELFWEIKNLNIIESHADDSFYQAKRTKELLESTDKFLKASIAVTDFDQLIKSHILKMSKQKLNETSINEKIAETWKSLAKKQIDPNIFIEDAKLMREKLSKTVNYFGVNRVPYFGPECGMRSFPTYESAMECLRRVAQAGKNAEK
jgi:methionine synthase II (cobalamin-independent)